jgi:hypothetical protein
MHTVVIILIALTVLVWVAWPAPSPPIAVKAVATEGVREQRMDAFRSRWLPVVMLQSAYAWDEPEWITAYRQAALPATVDLARGGDATADSSHKPVETGPVVIAKPPPARTVRRAALRTSNVCARHGMRKVMVGRYRWRCRR